MICLQETHLGQNEMKYLKDIFHKMIYYAAPISRSKGVVEILKNLLWELRDSIICDEVDCLIVLKGF